MILCKVSAERKKREKNCSSVSLPFITIKIPPLWPPSFLQEWFLDIYWVAPP